MELLTVLLIFSGMVVGWAIGSNDSANCLGTSVGAQILSTRKAVWIVAIFALLGAALQGDATIGTIGNGIIDPMYLSAQSVIAILLGAGFLVIGFTLLGMPVSTTQAVIGGIAGVGLTIAAPIKWPTIGKIMGLGFLTPLFALVVSFITYKIFQRLTAKVSFLKMEHILGWIIIGSGAFLAYSLGANNIGNAMGLVVAQGVMVPVLAGVVGGLALGFGSITLGKKVIRTVGHRITELDPIMAFTAQTGAAVSVYALALMGIPTSTSFGIVGGVAGTGLVKGVAAVNRGMIGKIFLGWVVTPLLGALIAAITYRIFMFIGI
ncbi:MAG: inorganic phosphate transporter [Candidatus Woesearchaeota archaeon]